MAILLRAGDPALNDPFLDKALEGMILSASGWRGIFAETGNEEDTGDAIKPVHGVIAALAAEVFAGYLIRKNSGLKKAPVVILGMDTRPTGPAIADPMIRLLLVSGCRVRYTGITAAPEIMAFARLARETPNFVKADGFVYISASHNPIGHNGLKFGLDDGGVLPASETKLLIEEFRRRLAEPDRISRIVEAANQADSLALDEVYAAEKQVKQEAFQAYLDFTREVCAGSSDLPHEGPGEIPELIARGLQDQPLGVAADFNGSARTVSIDREFLGSLGVTLHGMNDKPGEIAHRIVPEGESLDPCCKFLEKLHENDPSVMLGYVPDCDGDRGNLVFWDHGEQKARALEAQEVFALACVSELAHLVWTGELKYDNKGNALTKAAVAVNDPTSMRIDRIARAFDVSVFRAEVGEANVVGLARKLREQGYLVRILGEGSAGGNITHPSAVRDPINTLVSLIKLLAIRSEGERKGFFELWCNLSDQAEIYRPDFTLSDIIAALPAFISTGTYTPEAVLQVKTTDHGLLKSRYQKIFLREWEERKELLRTRYGITGWEAAVYNGMEEKRGISDFSIAGKGGLKISFINKTGHAAACIWMRGSGTEPVFRVMADVEGSDRRIERALIEWQRKMVSEADNTRGVV
ncbi:phosphohexose mutase family protein [Treponema primitia ZAS-2]|uniref:Phosphohexose mutase family protein n=1 Tax=Treponema primitia (strain ATCC BAA-887 / DSM 12427 / ZAS-2) TaxID=545694 RepID=F5YQL0_TREPZ|nr:phosphatidylglycerol lysyltransferase [Treponema primitia]AEF85696.1 phosphohexose mutase family protein [Treponema primitia ZAS-2]